MNFADRLLKAIEKRQNPSVVGLDPDFAKIPKSLKKDFKEPVECILEFNRRIIDAIMDIVPAVKLQSAFYEMHGHEGVGAFEETARYAKRRGLVVVGDVKRNDIGNTARAYSSAFLGKGGLDLDCITVNAYLGTDGVQPFIDDCSRNGKGLFVLVKTSNPSSRELQDLSCGDEKLYEIVAKLVNRWGKELKGRKGYSSIGAVVGATHPNEAVVLRKLMPKCVFLVPGYGAQGGGAADIVPCFNKDGMGAVVNSSRGIIFAYQKTGNEREFDLAAAEAAVRMREAINKALRDKGICPW